MTMRIHGDKIEFPDGTEQFTASSGGGGDAQPAVAFSVGLKTSVSSGSDFRKLSFDDVLYDDDSLLKDGKIVIKKEGYYQLSSRVGTSGMSQRLFFYIRVNDTRVSRSSDASIAEGGHWVTSFSTLVKLNAGDEIELEVYGEPESYVISDSSVLTNFSGHMVSSITEGEVKEKEAVVFRGELTTSQPVTSGVEETVKLDSASIDTSGAFDNGKFKPTVKGWYQVNGAVGQTGTPNATRIVASLYKNGSAVSYGVDVTADKTVRNTVSDIIYFDGVNDYLELAGYILSTSPDVAFNASSQRTYLSGSLITGQSTGGGTGGGEVQEAVAMIASGLPDVQPKTDKYWNVVEFDSAKHDTENCFDSDTNGFKIKTAGYYQINGALRLDGTNDGLSGMASAIFVNDDQITQGVYVRVQGETKEWVNPHSDNTSILHYLNVDDVVTLRAYANTIDETRTINKEENKTFLTLHLVTGQSSGGSGGSYTPEKLVWEDVGAERDINVVYTNDWDVPRYVSYWHNSKDTSKSVDFRIDGERVGVTGNPTGTSNVSFYALHIVPSGSTYELLNTGSGMNIGAWREARMPVAVGTGGKTVAFRAYLGARQTVETGWTKVNLDTATIDTDNTFTDGGFKPSVAGYYQITGSVNQSCNPASTNTVARLMKNNSTSAIGSEIIGTQSQRSVVTDLFYLDPDNKWTDSDGNEQVGDYVELWGAVTSSGDCNFTNGTSITFLSAVLVSGGSASGDSGTTQEHGEYTPTITNLTLGNGTQKAVYTKTGDMVTFKITVTFGSTTNFTGDVTGIVDGLPFEQHEDWVVTPLSGYAVDSGSGYRSLFCATSISGSKNIGYLQATASELTVNPTVPITWGVNDQINITGTYRIKS